MSAVNTIWVLWGAALVFFMQAGFAMVETGFTRAKNAGNIIMKNLMDFCIGAPLYWIAGFGIMFGVGNGFWGTVDFMSKNDYTSIIPAGVSLPAFMIFQTVFCATAATIVSGAMAERTKFSSYCIYSAIISLLVYPVSGHWIWGNGWLASMGFHDFAGSTAVHMLGGVSALVGAWILGPRIGKYDKEGKAKAMPGHSLTLGALGVFILWFCWFAFNGASTVSMEGDKIELAGKIFMTTNLSATVATVTVMLITWVKYKKPDISMTLNGSLAGLVGITAGCDTVSPLSAAFIGFISGIALVFSIEFIDKKLKVDDPVGAIGVHGVCGMLGTILVGLFSDGTGTESMGLLLGGGLNLLFVQLIGIFAVILWVSLMMAVTFLTISKTIGLRVSQEVEIAGLDVSEHGISSSHAYFAPATFGSERMNEWDFAGDAKGLDLDQSVPVEFLNVSPLFVSERKITNISIICRQNKFEDLKNEMDKIGVTGLTVTNVLGCGTQKGSPEYYRGVSLDIILLPKIKVEIIVSKVPVRTVIETARKALYTGHIGDGKIFVYNVENVVRIRTGEEGFDALQDNEDR